MQGPFGMTVGDEAVVWLEKARALHEEAPSAFNDWMTWSWLGHAYYWAGDTTQARNTWESRSGRSAPWFSVGWSRLSGYPARDRVRISGGHWWTWKTLTSSSSSPRTGLLARI